MSYCRFSSDSFRCDVYVFDDVMGGITTYVAGNRSEGDTERPILPRYTEENADAYFEADKALSEWLDTARRVPIELPHAGERFNHGNEKECGENLIRLKAIGYNIPQAVIDSLINGSSNDVE